MHKSPRLLIQLENFQLSTERADHLRAFVLSLKPKTCLVMANWPWLEARGLKPAAEQQLLQYLRANGLPFRQLKTVRESRLCAH